MIGGGRLPPAVPWPVRDGPLSGAPLKHRARDRVLARSGPFVPGGEHVPRCPAGRAHVAPGGCDSGRVFGPEPTGRVPDGEAAVELDDVFLSGDPLAYFEGRVERLLADWQGRHHLESELAEEYLAALGINVADLPVVDERARALQVCLDAFALRHHVAETLLRFVVAVMDAKAATEGTSCLWYHASASPNQVEQLLIRYRAITAREDVSAVVLRLLLPAETHPCVATDPHLQQAMDVMLAWTDRAHFLLSRTDLNLNGMANKIKHGLVTRARDDHRIDVHLRQPPVVDGGVPASVLNGPGARPLLDAAAVETIGRPTSKEAVEPTVLTLRPARLLAEAHMMAVVHAAAFHVAAVAHLGDRDVYVPAPYPKLSLGPTPERVHHDAFVGSRRPITFRKDGQPTERKTGLAFETVFVPITVTPMGTFTVNDG